MGLRGAVSIPTEIVRPEESHSALHQDSARKSQSASESAKVKTCCCPSGELFNCRTWLSSGVVAAGCGSLPFTSPFLSLPPSGPRRGAYHRPGHRWCGLNIRAERAMRSVCPILGVAEDCPASSGKTSRRRYGSFTHKKHACDHTSGAVVVSGTSWLSLLRVACEHSARSERLPEKEHRRPFSLIGYQAGRNAIRVCRENAAEKLLCSPRRRNRPIVLRPGASGL